MPSARRPLRLVAFLAVTPLAVGPSTGCDVPPTRRTPPKGSDKAPARPAGTPTVAKTPEALPPLEFKTEPTKIVEATDAIRGAGAALFARRCAACHGDDGRGDGRAAYLLYPKPRDFHTGPFRFASTWDGVPTDQDLYRIVSRGIPGSGMPIRPRNLMTGVFKGGARAQDVYARIVGGIHGTPMPAAPALHGDDAWHVVHWVRSLSSDRLRDRAEMKRYRISAVRAASVPDHPDAGAWRAAPPTELHLMPLWWRYQRPEYLTVRAMHDGKTVAIQLVWNDVSHNKDVIRPQDFRDAAAIQLTNLSDPPLFAMGERGKFVNIWMWKAERQAELKGFRDMDAQYPNIGIDSYPNLQKQAYEQPMRKALTLDSDRTFVTAWAAGNVVADPHRRRAVEDLSAQGFGTLRTRSAATKDLEGFGVYDKGSYRVVFRRKLAGAGEHAVTLTPGRTTLVGFAVWDGAAGDRDGRKSVTIWQELVLAP